MEVFDIRPILAPAVSVVCAGLLFLLGRREGWRRVLSLSAAGLEFLIILSMLPGTMRGVVYSVSLMSFTPGIGLGFRVDALGMFFALVCAGVWFLTMLYAIGYMQGEHSQARFFGFFTLCVSTTVGIAFAENLLTMFVFYEMLTVCTYPLLVHEETPEAMKVGRKYLIYTFCGSALILLAVAITYVNAKTLTVSRTGILPMDGNPATLKLLFALFVVGFGVKAAIMPLHGWLPSAMVAPVPVSALLHAIAVVKAGGFGIIRVIYNVYGVELMKRLDVAQYLAYAACFTIVAGSILAIRQTNLKRRLAYSTISQMSYIILGASLLTPLGATAAIVHIANEGFQKVTMFFCAGAIERMTGRREIGELSGIGYQMPWTMGAFTIASLGFIGVPLFAGFMTKWYLSLGALQGGQYGYVLVMILSSLLNAACWLPIIYRAYFDVPPGAKVHLREARPLLLAPTLVSAGYVVLLGSLADVPGLPLSIARAAVTFVFRM